MTTANREIDVATLMTGYLENVYQAETGKTLTPLPVYVVFDRLLRHLHGKHKGSLKPKGFYGEVLRDNPSAASNLINLCLGDEFNSSTLEDVVPQGYFGNVYQDMLGAVEGEYEDYIIDTQNHVQAELSGVDKTTLLRELENLPCLVEDNHGVDLLYPELRFYNKNSDLDWDTVFPIRFLTINNGKLVDCDAKTALASTYIYEAVGEYDHAEFTKFLSLLVLMTENQHAI